MEYKLEKNICQSKHSQAMVTEARPEIAVHARNDRASQSASGTGQSGQIFKGTYLRDRDGTDMQIRRISLGDGQYYPAQ